MLVCCNVDWFGFLDCCWTYYLEGGVMDIQKIKELALANGFSLKEQASGNMDLHSYVYEFANAIEQAVKAQAVPEGFVEKTESNTHHYFKLKDWDEWTCIDGIKDAITSDHDINAIVEVECLEVIEINNKPCFALLAFGKRHGTEVKFFDTEEEAIEAQEPTND